MDDRTQENLKFLDTIDFIPYLDMHFKNVYELMGYIQDDFEEKGLETFEDGFVFNWVSDYEFADYLKNRYPNIIRRVIEASNDYYLQDDYCMLDYVDDSVFALNNEELGAYIKNTVVQVRGFGDDRFFAIILPRDPDVEKWLERAEVRNNKLRERLAELKGDK